jgi:hypothetical protein
MLAPEGLSFLTVIRGSGCVMQAASPSRQSTSIRAITDPESVQLRIASLRGHGQGARLRLDKIADPLFGGRSRQGILVACASVALRWPVVRPNRGLTRGQPGYFFAVRLPAAMITKTAKATNAHHATLSVSFCHFRMSHMSSA